MKAGELRIGNWFVGYDNKPFQWDLTHFSMLVLEQNAPEVDELIRGPIPLTEEILLKCGFELSDCHWDYWNPDEELSFCMTIFEDGMFFSAGEGIRLNKYPIEYVHQLQDLFCVITGKELEVRL